ncbi:MAG: hypothetical protein M1833_005199 [Piccolia ochrophora]|nr:MAG: hypothetical protein M1833_005199 [Piccolia ochrophora]
MAIPKRRRLNPPVAPSSRAAVPTRQSSLAGFGKISKARATPSIKQDATPLGKLDQPSGEPATDSASRKKRKIDAVLEEEATPAVRITEVTTPETTMLAPIVLPAEKTSVDEAMSLPPPPMPSTISPRKRKRETSEATPLHTQAATPPALPPITSTTSRHASLLDRIRAKASALHQQHLTHPPPSPRTTALLSALDRLPSVIPVLTSLANPSQRVSLPLPLLHQRLRDSLSSGLSKAECEAVVEVLLGCEDDGPRAAEREGGAKPNGSGGGVAGGWVEIVTLGDARVRGGGGASHSGKDGEKSVPNVRKALVLRAGLPDGLGDAWKGRAEALRARLLRASS